MPRVPTQDQYWKYWNRIIRYRKRIDPEFIRLHLKELTAHLRQYYHLLRFREYRHEPHYYRRPPGYRGGAWDEDLMKWTVGEVEGSNPKIEYEYLKGSRLMRVAHYTGTVRLNRGWEEV